MEIVVVAVAVSGSGVAFGTIRRRPGAVAGAAGANHSEYSSTRPAMLAAVAAARRPDGRW